MPKEVWNNGTLSVELDPNDPQDAAEITVNAHRGKSIAGLTVAESLSLLRALNTKYNLGLLP